MPDARFPSIHKTLAELTALVGGKLEGDASYVIESAAGLAEAGPRDISFLGNPKYAEAAAASGAGCLLLPPAAQSAPCRAANKIYVEDPQYAFSQVLGVIESMLPKAPAALSDKASIHYQARLAPGVNVGDFAVIERGAAIGEGTTIAPQVFIGENARIGRNCRIYPQVVIRENCEVGDRAIIHSGVVIGSDGYGFSTDRKTGKHRKIPQLGNVVVKEDVEIGAGVTIDRATIGSTVIGAGTKIDNLVQLGHNVQVGRDCLIVAQVGVSGSTSLGDRVILAGQAGLAGHIHVGDGAIVLAQSGIMSDVEKGQVLFGSPGRPRREAFKLMALTSRLPEFYETLKELKTKAGLAASGEHEKA